MNLALPNTQSVELLPTGLPAFMRTLEVMAQYVRRDRFDVGLRLCAFQILSSFKVAGHDHAGEVAGFFFMSATALLTAAIRWALIWCLTPAGCFQPAPATVTNWWCCSARSARWRALKLVSSVWGRSRRSTRTSTARHGWMTGAGSRLIRRIRGRSRAGQWRRHQLMRGGLNTRFSETGAGAQWWVAQPGGFALCHDARAGALQQARSYAVE